MPRGLGEQLAAGMRLRIGLRNRPEAVESTFSTVERERCEALFASARMSFSSTAETRRWPMAGIT